MSNFEIAKLGDLGQLNKSMMAVVSFLSRYSGNTRATYEFYLHSFFQWCADNGMEPLDCKRFHIELYLRWLEEVRKNAPGSVAAKIHCLKGYFMVAVADGYLYFRCYVILLYRN